jgi:hypothetical protein
VLLILIVFVSWYLLAMSSFGTFTPYGREDIEAYLGRFTSFLFTKGVILMFLCRFIPTVVGLGF